MFEDEARFGRMREPRQAWGPPDMRPLVGSRIEREYSYVYAELKRIDVGLSLFRHKRFH